MAKVAEGFWNVRVKVSPDHLTLAFTKTLADQAGWRVGSDSFRVWRKDNTLFLRAESTPNPLCFPLKVEAADRPYTVALRYQDTCGLVRLSHFVSCLYRLVLDEKSDFILEIDVTLLRRLNERQATPGRRCLRCRQLLIEREYNVWLCPSCRSENEGSGLDRFWEGIPY